MDKKPFAARHMNVNEIVFKQGYRYRKVVSDRDVRALALSGDRSIESPAAYLRSLTDGQLQIGKILSMDRNARYISAAGIHLSCVVEKIAVDWFHVAK